MPTTLTQTDRARASIARGARSATVLVACPDARPPAYEAAAGLAEAGLLQTFLTGFYHKPHGPAAQTLRSLTPCHYARWRKTLRRRHHPRIPADRVASIVRFDLALAVERRLGSGRPEWRGRVARWRTRTFDRSLARRIERERPDVLLVFSDVGSEFALPLCRRLGIPAILSMVHGDVREERLVLAEEERRDPEFFKLYLGDAAVDRGEMAWLHERRLRDIELADLVLVPSAHIAGWLERHGTPRDRIRVVPYAADLRRFRPDPNKRHDDSCTFLFTGGICQRKGIKDLLEAWRVAKRPGWRLQLLGALPRALGPMAGLLEGVELLGRVPHSEVPARMAKADVFVFPSLFEGSAVVTYEALAGGLPCVVTPSAGSVVRDGVEGLVVPPRDSTALAGAMGRLGSNPRLRSAMGHAARARAERFDWPRYHASLVEALADVVGR